MPGESGTCGFCGYGDGYLTEQGDELSIYLHSAVRTGEAPDWKYERHPNALPDHTDDTRPGQQILWCGNCLGGLAHMWQRHDDHNLNAEFLALSLWLELDGPRWTLWDASGTPDAETVRKYGDDTAIHMDKLGRQRRKTLAENERFRRAGFDLTTRGWRP